MMLQACEEFGHLHSLRHSKLVISYGACVDVPPPPPLTQLFISSPLPFFPHQACFLDTVVSNMLVLTPMEVDNACPKVGLMR